jgi:pimeloyl-ACP methyl ester carboxylesterase
VHRRISYVLAAAALSAGAAALSTPAVAHPVAANRADGAQLTVGTLTLNRCSLAGKRHPSYCASIKVPLDYNSSKDGTITTGFGWFPATDPAPAGPAGSTPPTIVAEEGGPGYPSTGSATDYLPMLGNRLLATHNLLLVDERGTGTSTPINCRPMEAIHVVTTSAAFLHTVRSCGHSLDHRFPRAGGGFVHASDLFTTANSTRDMARVLNALKIGKVDLYGDSYGTYFSQSFLSHFPHRVRSVVLDSAYEARDLDPWYVTTVQAARRAFDAVCRRSAACHAAAPGKSWHRIARLAALLRRHPFTGRAPGVDAHPVPVRMTVTSLVNLVNDAGYDYDPYRQLDAAARSYLSHRDPTPLLRLYAQDIGYDYSDYNASPTYYSDGQYFAVGCSDYPQLFDMRAAPARRRAELASAERHYPARAFAPFTVREWLRVDPFTEAYHACTAWPRRVHKADPPVVPHVSMDATGVPVLILNGSLDSLTPAAGGAHIHRQIGATSRHVVVANMVHLVGDEDPYGCGQTLVRRFFRDPAALHTMDVSCARTVPAVRAVGSFPTRLRQAAPAHGTGNRMLRRRAAVALAAAGDAATRRNYVDGNRDVGLHGGAVRYRAGDGSAVVAHLEHVKWTDDTSVVGTVTFTTDGLSGHGTVVISGAGGRALTCHLTWSGATATIRAAGHHLHAPAP